jgi:mono/diheme cytochrome c family protein
VTRRTWTILRIALVAVVVLLVLAISVTIGWRPLLGPKARPLTDRKFEATPARLERGRYLAHDLLGCLDCHSERDRAQHDAPLLSGGLGSGAVLPIGGFRGRIAAPNVTPDQQTGAGRWTDDQLARAIREGIAHDGHALFYLMPWESYRHLSDDDLASVVVYLRSLKPVRHVVPPMQIPFPIGFLMRSAPQPITRPVARPDLSTAARRGEYLVTIAGCDGCHTPRKRGVAVAGLEFGGGSPFKGPWGEVASANITPDDSGISYYDTKLFVQVMRTGYVGARELKSIMPWWHYRGLGDGDLEDMFAYLRTLKPARHRVDNTEAAARCRLCGLRHGAGSQN